MVDPSPNELEVADKLGQGRTNERNEVYTFSVLRAS